MRTFVDARTSILQEESTRAVLQAHIEPTDDIAAERRRATFDVTTLKYFMNGGKAVYDRKVRLCELVSNTDWGDKSQRYFVSMEEEYVNALKAALGIWDLMMEQGFRIRDGAMIRKMVSAPGGLEVHIGMFIPAIMGIASPEQKSEWLPLAQSLAIIGSYAQTELGHGTFVRGLQTTATYDGDTDEFIIHTPTETATKWWPGGLGKTASHVVLMARLFIRGVDYGPHAFMVQIRSLETHQALPGITVGDIGPKFGYNGVDNGFLSFDHVRISRQQMLMRFARVTEKGEYIKPPPSNTKASYVTMIFVRSAIVEESAMYLGKAATISVRYCCVRRQTAIKPGMKETQLIDYQNVGATLVPVVAACYALHFAGQRMMAMYKEFEKSREQGDFRVLPELHAVSSGLKAVCSWEAAEGIERCRFCCGGHGYSRLSGLPDLYASYVQNVTWEGDNDVLCLQAGRSLLKAMSAAPGKRIGGYAAYLQRFVDGSMALQCPVNCPVDWMCPQVCLEAFQFRAGHLCRAAETTLRGAADGKLVVDGVEWNNNTVCVIQCAVAHSWTVVLQIFLDALNNIKSTAALPVPTVEVLQSCMILLALTKIEKYAADLLEAQYLSPVQLQMLKKQKNVLIQQLRPNAVALVDSLGYLDYELNSALGRHDGDVYRGLLQMAQASLLNRTQEGPAWKTVLEPRMRPRSKM